MILAFSYHIWFAQNACSTDFHLFFQVYCFHWNNDWLEKYNITSNHFQFSCDSCCGTSGCEQARLVRKPGGLFAGYLASTPNARSHWWVDYYERGLIIAYDHFYLTEFLGPTIYGRERWVIAWISAASSARKRRRPKFSRIQARWAAAAFRKLFHLPQRMSFHPKFGVIHQHSKHIWPLSRYIEWLKWEADCDYLKFHESQKSENGHQGRQKYDLRCSHDRHTAWSVLSLLVCLSSPKPFHKLLLWNALGNRQTSQEHLKVIVYGKCTGTRDWKIWGERVEALCDKKKQWRHSIAAVMLPQVASCRRCCVMWTFSSWATEAKIRLFEVCYCKSMAVLKHKQPRHSSRVVLVLRLGLLLMPVSKMAFSRIFVLRGNL